MGARLSRVEGGEINNSWIGHAYKQRIGLGLIILNKVE